MINRTDQHARQVERLEQTEHTGPVDFDQLLELAALAGVPVMRSVDGRLEVHEPPALVLAQAPIGGGEMSVPLSPRFPSPSASEVTGGRPVEPEPSDLERKVTRLGRPVARRVRRRG